MLPRATSLMPDMYRFSAWQAWLSESTESQQRHSTVAQGNTLVDTYNFMHQALRMRQRLLGQAPQA